MPDNRMAHHDDWFHEMCERNAQRLTAAASPTAIDTYSLEKLVQVQEGVRLMIEHVERTTGREDGDA